jgi:Flp pilus assembly protein TadD
MTRPHEEKNTDNQFLLSEPAGEPAADKCGPIEVSTEALEVEFPDLLSDARFIEQSVAQLEEDSRFGAIILQIDDLAEQADAGEVLAALFREAGKMASNRTLYRGLMDGCRLAAVFPGASAEEALDCAKSLQERFTEKTGKTATAGAAAFPTLTYAPSEIIDNAGKALVHAEFFGPGSRAAFDAVSLNISGDQHYQSGAIDSAISDFNRALALDPENVNVHNSLGVCHGVKGDLDTALACFDKAMHLDPEEVMPVYNAGYVYVLKADYPSALAYFSRAGKIDPGVFELALQTGRTLIKTGAPEKALSHLEKAARLQPKASAAFRLLGECYHMLERLSDAAGAYKTALKLNPEDAQALSSLGFIYEILGQNADIALLFCQQGSEMAPENALFRHRLGRIHFNRGNYEEALAHFQEATELGHDSTEYIERLGDMIDEGRRSVR